MQNVRSKKTDRWKLSGTGSTLLGMVVAGGHLPAAVPIEVALPTGGQFAGNGIDPWDLENLCDELMLRQQRALARLQEANEPLSSTDSESFTTRFRRKFVVDRDEVESLKHFRAVETVPDTIARIRASLSLQMTELADALGVERPTVYAWIKKESSPHAHNRTRLAQIGQIADAWNAVSKKPLGDSVREATVAGTSVLALLKAQDLMPSRFREVFAALAKRQRMHGDSSRIVSSILDEHGSRRRGNVDDDEQFDILTGKRPHAD